MENRVENLIAKLKEISTNPIAVGFGISPEHVKKVCEWGADESLLSAFVNEFLVHLKKMLLIMLATFVKICV